MKTGASWRSVIYAGWLLYYIVIANRRGIFLFGRCPRRLFQFIQQRSCFISQSSHSRCASSFVQQVQLKSLPRKEQQVQCTFGTPLASRKSKQRSSPGSRQIVSTFSSSFYLRSCAKGTTFDIVPCTVPKDHCFFDQRYAQKFSTLKLPEQR